jgi:5'-nucleotidase
MNILISNDDGWQAPGLLALHAALEGLGKRTVVAPDRNRSGASNSLTLDAPLRVMATTPGWYAVNGTPTDCVHLAISGLLSESQQVVLSGINDGANLGDDVLYSGTVAAAMEGRSLGCPSVAFSLVAGGGRHFQAAGRLAREFVERLLTRPLPAATLYNVNFPDLPYEEVRGWRATRLGARHPAEPIVLTQDPRGRPMYWVGAPGDGQDAGAGTDFDAILQGYVSVTPLQVDLTRHEGLQPLADWLGAK